MSGSNQGAGRTFFMPSRVQKAIEAARRNVTLEIPNSFAFGINSTNASNPSSLCSWDNSTCKFHFAPFMKFESHYFTTFVLPRRYAWYNSSSKLQCTLFLKLGSHYQRVSLIASANPSSELIIVASSTQ